MTTLAELADDTLSKLQVDVLPVAPLLGQTWNVGEPALGMVRITNTTGLPLRNVYVDTLLYGTAAQYQPCNSWDGNGGLIGDMELGDTATTYCALLKGVSVGVFGFMVNVSADVVPFAEAGTFWASYTVEAPS